jgi:ABC-2 type transport system ATP-binding protein
MSSIVLETKNLTKIYGKLMAVDEVEIAAYEGEVFGFLGPNGAGKTTTLGMALGLTFPTRGEVWVLGERVTPHQTRPLRQVGALLGAPAFVPYLSARENLQLLARLHPGVDNRRIADVLDLVGLSEVFRRKVSKFSTGMKQRVGLAMALLHRPRLVILDEPTNGLDPAGMREVRQLIRFLAGNGTSVLLSSHLLNEVQQVCDRIAVLNRGRVVAQGLVSELLNGQKPAVLVQVSDSALALSILHSLPGVEEVALGPDGKLTVVGVEAQAVMNCLLQNSLVPSEISTRQQDLESLFLTLTNGESIPAVSSSFTVQS